MDKEQNKVNIEKITEEIEKIDNKEFKFFFFVMDTKGVENASLSYIYETALTLKELGYKVAMLHGEKEFIGPSSWLGDKYNSLVHYNIETDNVRISPADILIIPEMFSNVMFETRKLSCKRIALLQNYNYLTETIQPGVTWEQYGIRDCITTNNMLKDKINASFKNLNVEIVSPAIDKVFTMPENEKKLIINVVAKNPSDVNLIVKPFFWFYPNYQWIVFNNVRGLSREDMANVMKDSFATIWVDSSSNFGYTPLEAMATGNIVIGKITEEQIDWMYDSNGNLKDNGIWLYNMNDIYDVIADVIQTYLHDKVPDVLLKNMKETVECYTLEKQVEDIKRVYIDKYVSNRRKELEIALSIVKNNEEKV